MREPESASLIGTIGNRERTAFASGLSGARMIGFLVMQVKEQS